jgi:hypothetical protein
LLGLISNLTPSGDAACGYVDNFVTKPLHFP